jgi:hypothetical protein
MQNPVSPPCLQGRVFYIQGLPSGILPNELSSPNELIPMKTLSYMGKTRVDRIYHDEHCVIDAGGHSLFRLLMEEAYCLEKDYRKNQVHHFCRVGRIFRLKRISLNCNK